SIFKLPVIWLLVSMLLNTVTNSQLHSFPTRRSSDLDVVEDAADDARLGEAAGRGGRPGHGRRGRGRLVGVVGGAALGVGAGQARSEEHTSELQSRFDFVCRLLLEKKNMDLAAKGLGA